MALLVEKPQLPRHLRYPLKSSEVEAALQAGGIDWQVQLVSGFAANPTLPYPVLDCHYWHPNDRVAYPRFYLSIRATTADLQAHTQQLLLTQALPELIRWMQRLYAQPANSTQLRHNLRFAAVLSQQGVSIQAE